MRKILVVDDHKILREALLLIIKDNMPPDSIICDDADSVASARTLLSRSAYDLVVLDIAMPGMSGIDYLPEIKSLYPATPVLMLSMYPEEQFALQAFRLGASGYLTKQEAADEILMAIGVIFDGGRYLSRSFSTALIDQFLHQVNTDDSVHDKLSRRELEILKLLAAGKTLKLVAADLGLSVKTVSTYKTRLCNKMGFRNNAELVCYAMTHNLN